MTEHTEECLSYQSQVGLVFCNCDCSDKHVHEWIPWEGEPWFFTCKDENCPRVLDILETTERVNATERFIAFMDEYYSIKGKVEYLASDIDEDRILKQIYADILEGK